MKPYSSFARGSLDLRKFLCNSDYDFATGFFWHAS